MRKVTLLSMIQVKNGKEIIIVHKNHIKIIGNMKNTFQKIIDKNKSQICKQIIISYINGSRNFK